MLLINLNTCNIANMFFVVNNITMLILYDIWNVGNYMLLINLMYTVSNIVIVNEL